VSLSPEGRAHGGRSDRRRARRATCTLTCGVPRLVASGEQEQEGQGQYDDFPNSQKGQKAGRLSKALTPDERKQRRLESNRLAAKCDGQLTC
jgi:hypothetical protein